MEMSREAQAENGNTPSRQEYYVKLGFGHDHLLRCKDCRRLVHLVSLMEDGGCPYCGCRRCVQINTLNTREWLMIRVGIIRFPYRKEFLGDFPGLLLRLKEALGVKRS